MPQLRPDTNNKIKNIFFNLEKNIVSGRLTKKLWEKGYLWREGEVASNFFFLSRMKYLVEKEVSKHGHKTEGTQSFNLSLN